MISLLNFILRQFFKAVEKDPFLAIEVPVSSTCDDHVPWNSVLQAFFPKNRSHWKQFSSWEPGRQQSRVEKTILDTRFPPDVEVKKGYSWSDQLGIVIAALIEATQMNLVTWTVEES